MHHFLYRRKEFELLTDVIVVCRPHHIAYELLKRFTCIKCSKPVFSDLARVFPFVMKDIDPGWFRKKTYKFKDLFEYLDEMPAHFSNVCEHCHSASSS